MKTSDERVLLIEAKSDDAARLLHELGAVKNEHFRVEWITELSTAIERVRKGGVGAVILDLALPDSDGLGAFKRILEAAPRVPILILAESDSEELAREAVQRGAQDYLIKKQSDGYRLRRAIRMLLDSRAADSALLEREIAHVTLDSIGEAVLRMDARGNIVYLNRVAEKMTGWPREEALERPVADVLRIIDRVRAAAVGSSAEIETYDKNATIAATSKTCILVRRDGFEVGIENTVTPIHAQDGSVSGTVVAFHDVSETRAKSLEMSHSAQHDPLTDLPNRVLFNDRLNQAISLAERQDKQLAVMFIDLDHFKKINDSLGHSVGDKLLQSVALRLTTCIRRTDTVSRLGGDEFVILLSQIEHEGDAAFSARKVLRSLSALHRIDNKSLDINVSIGISTYPTDGRDADSLMDNADTAMYEAKQRGRNTYQFFRREMHARVAERQLLEADLRYALGRNEFQLHYQPKINLRTGQITGVEALIRWMHPQRGLILPAQFVPIAEECGLISAIGRWVLLEACKQARAWNDSGLGIVPVAVNVSATEFGAKDFLSGVRAVLIATGVEPSNLELELTESVLMQDAESTVAVLSALKAMGVRLAIDDFGTGYSSFTYLRRYPMDALKIHRSFVEDITVDPRDATIVSAMIHIGKSLNQRVIAEGVETLAQLNFLESQGCGEGQGYYFSRPVPAAQAGRLLESGIRVGQSHLA
jgi:diguanylate cyclase (GGDEF)-like protein/PAS domain S-box-containing protein